MKRFRRAMLNTLTVGSLVLALAMAGSWVRSYWRYDWIRFVSDDARILRGMTVLKGRVSWDSYHGDLRKLTWKIQSGFWYDSYSVENVLWSTDSFLGIGWRRQALSSPLNVQFTEVSIPHAYLLALFAAIPMIRLYRRLRRGHLTFPGHCLKCGYDLRATPDRCPECGIDAPAAVARSA